MDDIAGVNLAQTHPSAGRRRYPAVDQLQLGAVDLPLIDLHGPFVLAHQGILGVQLLFGDGILFPQHLITLKIETGIPQQFLIMGHLPLGLGQQHLERPRVDKGQEITATHDLPLTEANLHELPVNAGLDGDRVEGSHIAEPRDIDPHIRLSSSLRRYRRGLGSSLCRRLFGGPGCLRALVQVHPDGQERRQRHDQPPEPESRGRRSDL